MSGSTQPTPPPHAAMLQMLFGQWTANIIAAVAQLGIPDFVESGPKSAAELAPEVGADPHALHRLMRAAAGVGVLAEGPDGRFSQTPLSATLCSNAQPSLRHVATFLTKEWHMMGWSRLESAVRTGKPVVDGIYGLPLFEYFAKNPEMGENFNHAMTALSTGESVALVNAYDFSGVRSITDVGGGHGLLLATILGRNPGVTGTLLDSPQVIEGARQGPLQPLMDRCALVAGNMFESVPAGADAYIMKYIIHDWPDELCLKILKNCRTGVNSGGRLLIADHVIPAGNDFTLGKLVDIEMLLFPGGKERTEEQFRDLLAAAGWRRNRVIPTEAPLSIVEGMPA